MITGVDLVEQQIRIARGEKIAFEQADLAIRGHAIELRVYAEDPANQFLPSVGTLQTYQRPEGEGIRLDDGYREHMDIPIFYDPMIAKLIAYGKDRQEAIQRLLQAIQDYHIKGVATTLPFGTFVLKHPAFLSGQFDTHFVQQHFSPELLHAASDEAARAAAIGALQWWFAQKDTLQPIRHADQNWWEQRK
jgi:acetyl-CoA carboxylase, biotin carboxylase subunit